MNASKLHWRNATQNTIRFSMSMVVLTAALLATTFGVPAFQRARMHDLAASHGGWVSDMRSYLRNPIDYFAMRSPGARGSGQLIQSKHRAAKLAGNDVKPHEEVLSNVRYGSPVPAFVNDLVPGPAPAVIAFNAPIPAIGTGGVNGGTPAIPPPVVPVSNPSGSSPGGTPQGATVPESSTWLMLIWGMALVGFGLRSRHRPRTEDAGRMGFRAQI